MPNYEVHVWLAQRVGIAVGILVGLIVFLNGLINTVSPDILNTAIISLILGLTGYFSTIVGGTAPDIDLSRSRDHLKTASIPYRKLVKILRLLVVIIVLLGYVQFVQESAVLMQAIGGIIAVSLVITTIRLIPDILHRFMPAHRTVTHDLGFWIATGLLSVWVIQQILVWIQTDSMVETFLPIAVGLPVFLGAVTHVSADKIKNYVRDYAPNLIKEGTSRVAAWVPNRKPIIVDIPQMVRVLFDGRAPTSIRILVLFTVAYGLMPLDIISDVIPVIGWTDDLGIYLTMRSTVYNSYENNEGIVENIQRRIKTIFKIYIPILIFSVLALALIYYVFVS